MKTFAVLITLLISVGMARSQEMVMVPELTPEQAGEVMYQHVIAYALTGVDFAKSQGVSPKAYGQYVGEQFKMFWNPDDDIWVFANRMMYILTGLHPANELELLEESPGMVRFRLKNVDLPFREGPAFGVTYKEYLDFSEGIIATLAGYLGLDFSHKMNGEWYEVTVTRQPRGQTKMSSCCEQG
jgi:hypothetical protein